MTPMNHDLPQVAQRCDDDDFDRALRQCHASATAHLSARTQAQLHNRLRAATARNAHSMRPRWWLAAAGSLILVFAVGVQWRVGHRFPAPANTAPIAATSHDNGELVATLDEAPELYLWLASDDATTLASE